MDWKEFDSVSVSFCLCVDYVDLVASVVVFGWADVPSALAVACPCSSSEWCFMVHYSGADWRERGGVEVEGSFELGKSGDFGIDVGWS